jgi:cell division protein FtsB
LVKVNLLKPESSTVTKAITLKFGSGKLQRTVLLFSLILFIGGLILMAYTYYQKNSLSKISSQYTQAEKVKEEIKSLTKEKDKLASAINLLSGYLKREIIWSEKLYQMRGLIPKEAWLTKFSFEKRSGRDIDASFYLSGGLIAQAKITPIGILSNFVNQLKANKEFSADFDMPILTDLRSETKSGIEIMVFTIEMPLRKEGSAYLNESR